MAPLFKDRPRLTLPGFKTPPASAPTPPLASAPVLDQGQKPRPPTAHRVEIDRRAALLRAELVRRFPRCFVAEDETPRPLKIGIKADIVAALPDVNPHDLINTLTAYCTAPAYYTAMIASTDRVDLDGNVAGPVSASAKRHSARKLAKFKPPTIDQ